MDFKHWKPRQKFCGVKRVIIGFSTESEVSEISAWLWLILYRNYPRSNAGLQFLLRVTIMVPLSNPPGMFWHWHYHRAFGFLESNVVCYSLRAALTDAEAYQGALMRWIDGEFLMRDFGWIFSSYFPFLVSSALRSLVTRSPYSLCPVQMTNWQSLLQLSTDLGELVDLSTAYIRQVGTILQWFSTD